MTFGDLIKQYRTDHGISMASFAEKAGITKGYVSLLESNKHPKTGKPIIPSVDVLKRIASAMNMSFDSLILQVDPDCKISWDKEDPIPFNDHELSMILKYRILDDLGQKTVDAVLDLQYERVRK